MLNAITVSNYRGFKAPTTLELRPITVLLGCNSSGKSSLTRLIPLIQQSLERQSSSPVLWASDAVDLGTIKDVINHDAGKDPLTIGFRIGGLSLDTPSLRRRGYWRDRVENIHEITYEIRLRADGIRTRFDGLSLSVDDQCLKLDWNDQGVVTSIKVNESEYPIPSEYVVIMESIFPDIVRVSDVDDRLARARGVLFYPPLRTALSEFFHKRTSSQKMEYWITRFPFISRSQVIDVVKQIPNIVVRRAENEEQTNFLSDCSLINDLPDIISYIGSHINAVMGASAYIGPSRASGNRFDRIQELAVNRIDASGLNTAMYLYSLDADEMSSFNDLLMSACGHMVEIEESGHGHVSIKVGRFGNAHFENVADVGFGFSQIIPVVAQLHAVQSNVYSKVRLFSPQVIFAVEQPELHLHPAMQANLADLFAKASSTGSHQSTSMLIETHSETLIARLGLLIAEGELSPEDVAIYFVSKDEIKGVSELSRAEFNGDGIIENWPVGFFSSL